MPLNTFSNLSDSQKRGAIDRHAVVSRHDVVRTKFDGEHPLQVGNGEFAFGMDITGLQTFAPFNTMSQWGWHSSPLPKGQSPSDFQGQVWNTHGRPIQYMMEDPVRPELSAWMAANPHRINLGRIGLKLIRPDGTAAALSDLRKGTQRLDLWHGIVTSKFEFDDEPVEVTTACHPSSDAIGVRIVSSLVKSGRVSVFLTCPGNSPLQFANFVGDWSRPAAFDRVGVLAQNRLNLSRRMDDNIYYVSLGWNGSATIDPDSNNDARHEVVLRGAPQDNQIEFTCAFAKSPLPSRIPASASVLQASREAWPNFWNAGGAIDLSGSADPRWKELERRVVLSQYLMKVNEAGSLPPQESGLVNNGWFGKFHLEMTWWHAAHWALWNRWPELNRSMGFYKKLMPSAKRRATAQGYLGARWPKCVGPEGEEWPHVIHGTLIWQQPHPIFFAELDYRAHPNRETLKKWMPIVDATADFMATYAFLDSKSNRYVLGPPMTVVSENTDARTTSNPTFELGYWRFGLRVAQEWRARMGLLGKPSWSTVLKGLAPLPTENGLYVLHEGIKDMWSHFNFEHPAITGALGWLPGDGADAATMRRTLHQIAEKWNFDRTWGWDFPMLAMCAARLGEPERAIEFLLTKSPGFQFDELGLATGGPFPYFPSNGGLLYAVAMMAAGWDGAPKRAAPGFPSGSWTVKSEGLNSAP